MRRCFQGYGILPYRHEAPVSPVLQDFTSAAIRRDSQYAFYGHGNTVLWWKVQAAVCRVCWIAHLRHAPLKRVLGGHPGRLHQNSKAVAQKNLKAKMYFLLWMWCQSYKSKYESREEALKTRNPNLNPIFSFCLLSLGRTRVNTRICDQRCHSDRRQHLRYQYLLTKATKWANLTLPLIFLGWISLPLAPHNGLLWAHHFCRWGGGHWGQLRKILG